MSVTPRVAVVVSRFNAAVTDSLLEGAREAGAALDVTIEDADIFFVPGAFELPLAASRLVSSDRYAGVACLGAVVRGETPHFDFVCQQAAAGIQQVSLASGKPLAFGVVTTDTMAQALARAGGDVGNKGYEAVATVVEMLETLTQIEGT